MKLILRNGRLLASAANRLIVGFANGCGCCGPGEPDDDLFLRFAPCGFAGGGYIWIISTRLEPNANTVFISRESGYTCYCFANEIRRRSQIPFGQEVYEPAAILSGFKSCCECSSSVGQTFPTYNVRCTYVTPDTYGQNGQECCCAQPMPAPPAWCVVNASLIQTTVVATGYSSTKTINISNNIGTETYTSSEGENYSSTYNIFTPGAPGSGLFACGYQSCRLMAEYLVRVLLLVETRYIPDGPDLSYLSTSSTCTSGSASGYVITSGDSYTITTQLSLSFSIVQGDQRACQCSQLLGDGVGASGMAIVPDELAGDPMGLLPE